MLAWNTTAGEGMRSGRQCLQLAPAAQIVIHHMTIQHAQIQHRPADGDEAKMSNKIKALTAT